jgi:hypothetical protein
MSQEEPQEEMQEEVDENYGPLLVAKLQVCAFSLARRVIARHYALISIKSVFIHDVSRIGLLTHDLARC